MGTWWRAFVAEHKNVIPVRKQAIWALYGIALWGLVGCAVFLIRRCISA
jgi:hypothetical protein